MTTRKYNTGMTLIELMVAMAIGMFLLIGAVSVFIGARTTFKITESVSRLQENGRFALDVLESDIRMGHYFGLTTRAYNVANRRKTTLSHTLGPTTCGNNWIIDLDNSIAASNNLLPLAQGAWLTSCPPSGLPGIVRQPNTDTIVVRRASEDIAVPVAGTWYIQSGRYALPQSVIFQGAALPAGAPPAATSETHRLIVNGYYVGSTSSVSVTVPVVNTVPSLRAKVLQPDGITILDTEIMPGVQDMQIQFGLDTDIAGAPTGRGSIDRYVNANDPILDPLNAAFNKDAEILSVRIWLLLRAETQEGGVGSQTFTYAGSTTTYNDRLRRVLVSKTIYLRNARTAT